MLFKQAQEVVDGRKRQTRRPVKLGEWAFMDVDDPTKILSVVGANRRLKWQVGKDYAAQPGRGKKSIGRTPPIEAIRRERLQKITPQAAKAEGVKNWYYHHGFEMHCGYVQAFINLWDSIYGKPYRWRQDPVVWVLKFEQVGEVEATWV